MKNEKTKNYNQAYIDYCSRIAPKTNEFKTLFHAFIVGGAICLIGQFVRTIFMYAFNLYGEELAAATSIVMIFLGAILTEIGDLFESYIKRRAGIKDMGKIMPGHGGIMDRIDGMSFASVAVFIWFLLI